MNFDKLPRGVALFILSYLTRRENLAVVAGVSRRYRSLARDPSMLRSVALLDRTVPFQTSVFRELVAEATQLRVLSLRYCQFVGEETMQVIAENANPFFLKELYLDGCENICDKALLKLTKPRAQAYAPINLQNYRVTELLAKDQLS